MKVKGIMYIVVAAMTMLLTIDFFDKPQHAIEYGPPYIFLIAGLLILASGIGAVMEAGRREKKEEERKDTITPPPHPDEP